MVSYGGVVLVTINYRLTAFGWFNASNAALKDTLLALHWVQENIESFGGDVSLDDHLRVVSYLIRCIANKGFDFWRVSWWYDD